MSAMVSVVCLAGALVLGGATSLPMERYALNVTTNTGNHVMMRIDTYNAESFVPPADSATAFTLPGGITWEDQNVQTATSAGPVTEASLGLSPLSAFMRAHGIVTIDQKMGKLIVGEFDPSGACREGHMVYSHQAEGAGAWMLPLEWDADRFGVSNVTFLVDYREGYLIVPRVLDDTYQRYFDRRTDEFAQMGRTYTVDDARREVPTIHLKAGDVDVPMTPEEYVEDGPSTEFTHNQMINAVITPFILDRMVLQLDLINHRIGVCTPN